MTRTAIKQLEAIRRSGKTNMLHRTQVQRIAVAAEFNELVEEIEEHSENYSTLLGSLPHDGDVPNMEINT